MIRRAVVEDAPSIHRLLKQILVLHKEMYPERFLVDSKYGLEEVEALICDDKFIVFVSDNNGIDGYIILKDYQDVLFIDDLCVDRVKRGQNIGTKLVESACAYAKEGQYKEIQLNVWLKNDSAIHFYEALGFEPLRTIYFKPTKKDEHEAHL